MYNCRWLDRMVNGICVLCVDQFLKGLFQTNHLEIQGNFFFIFLLNNRLLVIIIHKKNYINLLRVIISNVHFLETLK